MVCGHGIDFEKERERLVHMIPKVIQENDILHEVCLRSHSHSVLSLQVTETRAGVEDRKLIIDEALEITYKRSFGKVRSHS